MPTVNDNWDDDFLTAISPSALRRPHLKPQDNFGGLLSSDKLKAFASTQDLRLDTDNYDDDFEGDLTTVHRDETQEQTLRPATSADVNLQQRNRSVLSRTNGVAPDQSSTRLPSKANLAKKFELPPRPTTVYREQSGEDFSDYFVDNDNAFHLKVNQALRKVFIASRTLHRAGKRLTS